MGYAEDATPRNEYPEHLINWFDDFGTPDNHYRFLSNFYIGRPIMTPYGDMMTGEHFFQACKAITGDDFRRVQRTRSPGDSKSLGRRIQLREDWEAVKYDVMAVVIRSKFSVGREEADLLVETGNALLVEGTFWGDQVWGVDLKKPGWPGRNWLGTLLMARRAELVAGYDSTGKPVGYEAYHGNVLTSGWDWQVNSREAS